MKSRFLKIVGTITIINIVARLFGFAREIIIGYQYGTSFQADSIISAFTIPNFLFIVLGGAVTTAFISVYSKLGNQRQNDFAQTIFTGLFLVIGLITLLFMIFPKFWIGLVFSGMSEQTLALTSDLFIWTAPATLFLVLSMGLSGLHNVHENYNVSAFSQFIFNGIYLVIGVGLTPILFEYSYALGATTGSVLMFGLLIYFVRKQQLIHLRFKLVPLPEVKRFFKMVIPLLFGGATIQFYFIIQRIYAAQLTDGAIASMNYASKMTQFPQAVLMTSVTTIIYPMLTKAAGDNDWPKLSKAYQQGFRMLTIILVPASVFIFIYAQEIITFIFQYGNFSVESTNATYPLLQIFSVSIFSLALNMYITRFFYALEDTLLPTILNVLSVFVINIAVISMFIDMWGNKAIALGTVVSALVNMLLLIFFAKRKLDLNVSDWRFIIKVSAFSFVVLVSVWLISLISLGVFFSLMVGGLVTVGFILAGLRVLN